MIQVFGTKKSFDCKAAERFFKERRIAFQSIDIKEKPLSRGEFDSVVSSLTRSEGSSAKAIWERQKKQATAPWARKIRAPARIGAHLLQQNRTGNAKKTKQPPYGHGRYAPPRVSAHICSSKTNLGTPNRPSNRPISTVYTRPPRVSAHICSNKTNLGTTKRPSNRPMGKEDTRPRAYRRTFAPAKPIWERPKDQANALTRRTSAFFLFLSPRLPRRRCRSIRPSSAPMSFL